MKNGFVTLISTYGLIFLKTPLILNHGYPLASTKRRILRQYLTNTYMTKLTLTLIFSAISIFTIGQTISISTVTSAGDFVKNENGISMSWTMGEVFAQTIQDDNHLTEGFQQGELTTETSEAENATPTNNIVAANDSNLEVDMQVFPNPSIDYLKLKFEASEAQAVFVQVATLNGNKVLEQKFEIENGLVIQMDQFENLKQGTYLISVMKNEKIISTKRVIKMEM